MIAPTSSAPGQPPAEQFANGRLLVRIQDALLAQKCPDGGSQFFQGFMEFLPGLRLEEAASLAEPIPTNYGPIQNAGQFLKKSLSEGMVFASKPAALEP
jgi:hypothetical protein